jgi:hypothetical protein
MMMTAKTAKVWPSRVFVGGIEYWATGKSGHVVATGVPSREYEADDAARVWVDVNGVVYED